MQQLRTSLGKQGASHCIRRFLVMEIACDLAHITSEGQQSRLARSGRFICEPGCNHTVQGSIFLLSAFS